MLGETDGENIMLTTEAGEIFVHIIGPNVSHANTVLEPLVIGNIIGEVNSFASGDVDVKAVDTTNTNLCENAKDGATVADEVTCEENVDVDVVPEQFNQLSSNTATSSHVEVVCEESVVETMVAKPVCDTGEAPLDLLSLTAHVTCDEKVESEVQKDGVPIDELPKPLCVSVGEIAKKNDKYIPSADNDKYLSDCSSNVLFLN
ncbi:unnamed protein product [Arabis nemorensis]|uniref:Uncharacterized protein n=1 Tax=Arabis nemorensis TaxID=586526 RepID=A0A565CRZ0_9BRAS|nr:unnamed protein product [Arabis nemorensis]